MSLASHNDGVKLTIGSGGFCSLPVEGAMEAGNRFFDDLKEKGIHMIKPTMADADRVGKYAVDWWEGKGEWKGQGRGKDFKSTKLWMSYMVFAGSRYARMIPRKNLGQILLGSLCVTGQEYSTIEWTAAEPDGAATVSCRSESLCSEMDRFPILRANLTACIQEELITNPKNRKLRETYGKSATNYVMMNMSKELGVRGANAQLILRLFSSCRCPHTTSMGDVQAQDWQKKLDMTYSCSGDHEGRIIWRPSEIESEYGEPPGETRLVAENKRSFTCPIPCCGLRLSKGQQREPCVPPLYDCLRSVHASVPDQAADACGVVHATETAKIERCTSANSWRLWTVMLLNMVVLVLGATISKLHVNQGDWL